MKIILKTLYRLLILCPFLMVINVTHADQLVDLQQVLSTASNDYQLKSILELNTFTQKMPRTTPYLDKIEVRTETDKFDYLKQQYTLRFYPKGWGETKCSETLMQTKIQAGKLSYVKALNDVIKERYHLIINYLETVAMIEQERYLSANYKDQIRVLKKLSPGNLNFNINNLINIQNDYTVNQLKIVKLENRLTVLSHQIITLTKCDAQFKLNTEHIVQISDIQQIVQNFPDHVKKNNVCLKDHLNKISLAEQKYALEVAKSRDYLTYLEVEYDMDNREDPEKTYKVGLAFRLPFIHKDRDDIYRRKVDLMKERLKYNEADITISEKLVSLKLTIQRYIAQHQILARRQTDGEAAASFDIYRRMDGSDPMDMLKIKESMIKNNILIEESRYEILRQYVDLLDFNGMLGEHPMTNYLSNEQSKNNDI